MRGNVLVEQVDLEGNIIIDYDTSVSPKQLYEKIKIYFPKVTKDNNNIVGEYNGKKYSIRAKNITYLGNPHPIFKKRIQISNDLQDFYKWSLKNDYKPILLGVYTHKDTTVFCDFRIEDFVLKKAHNSSAHVYSDDIAAAVKDDFFQKVDAFNNKITVFSNKAVDIFFDDLFETGIQDYSFSGVDIEVVKRTQMPIEIVGTFEKFFANEEKEWNGIECYSRMIKDNYKNKYQPEWAGFYLEYEFEKYISNNSLQRIVRYAQDKTSGGIDLDLYFPTIDQYGDLKAHSDYSRGIQGNDWNTVFGLIKKGQHIFYIVCEHSTEKDSEYDNVVTKFWNKAQGKSNLMSYAKRMKHSVTLKKAYILDINLNNFQYLSKFKQGVNSNGKPREPKIMIDSDNLKHFIIKEIIIEG